MTGALYDLDAWRNPQPAPERLPPQNIEAEAALIGAVLVNNAAFHATASIVEPEHFVEEIHRRIWIVAGERIRAGQVADPITLKTYLGDHDLGGITVPAYLAKLAADAVTIVGAPDYARMVADLAARRAVIPIAQELLEIAHDAPPNHPAARIVEDAESALMALRMSRLMDDTGSRISAGDAAGKLLEEVDRIIAGEAKPAGVTTGIPDLDEDTGGMTPGDLWVVAGRAAMGKTIKATSLARAAAKAGAGTLLFPFEIGVRKAVARLLADLAYRRNSPIGYGQILKGQVDKEDRWCLDEARKRLAAMPLVFDAAPRGTLAYIAGRVRSEKERMKRRGVELKVVVLDYLKYIKASDRYKGQRNHEIGEITVALKELAKEQNVCVVLLAQLNRQTEGREDHRPGLADLKDSDDIATDADVIAFVYREHYYLKMQNKKSDTDVSRMIETEHEMDLIVAKNRDGATRTHKLWCDVACSKLSTRDLGGV